MSAMGVSEVMTAILENVLPNHNHEEAFCLLQRKPYSIRGGNGCAVFAGLGSALTAAEFGWPSLQNGAGYWRQSCWLSPIACRLPRRSSAAAFTRLRPATPFMPWSPNTAWWLLRRR